MSENPPVQAVRPQSPDAVAVRKQALRRPSPTAVTRGGRVENVEDVVSVGQKLQVEISDIDDRGKLSLHAVVEDEQGEAVEGDAKSEEAGKGDDRPRRPRQRSRRSRNDNKGQEG